MGGVYRRRRQWSWYLFPPAPGARKGVGETRSTLFQNAGFNLGPFWLRVEWNYRPDKEATG